VRKWKPSRQTQLFLGNTNALLHNGALSGCFVTKTLQKPIAIRPAHPH
jgi:hypothetical protein